MSLTRAFAERLLQLWAAGVPDEALEVSGTLLLDGIAVAAAGAQEPGPTILAGLAAEAGSDPVSNLIGRPFRVSPVDAARVNGVAMHVLDFEPMWNPANHALSTTLPALLALAQAIGRRTDMFGGVAQPSGRRILAALTMGIEAQGRLRRASGQYEPTSFVFHPPGVVGPIGSAVACGLLLGLEAEDLTHAMGIAASRCGTLMANVGTMTKALHCGQAAASGLDSALLAQRGFTADADALGGPLGYGAAFFGPDADPEILARPGDTFHVLDPGPAFKFYPSQYGTHFIITAALSARAALPTEALGAIHRVRIIAPRMAYVDRPIPVTGLAGKFSFQYAAAVALLDGSVTVESFTDERRFAPDLQRLIERVDIEVDSERPGRFDQMKVDVFVELDDGTRVYGDCDGPPGTWGRPAAAGLHERKALDCLAPAFGTAVARRIVDGARSFVQFHDVTPFLNMLCSGEAQAAE